MGERLGFVDSMRGLAALYVLLGHVYIFAVSGSNVVPSPIVDAILRFSTTGVVLFFVISAFSLCLTWPRHRSSGMPVLSYAISRFFRIAPLFYILIVVSVLCQVSGQNDIAITPGLLVASSGLVFNLFPQYVSGIVHAGWTVGVEVIFYAMFPLLLVPFERRRESNTFAHIFIASVLLSLAFAFFGHFNPLFLQRSILNCLPSFLVGMIAFAAYEKLTRSDDSKPWVVAATAMAITFLMMRALLSSAIKNPWAWTADALAYATILTSLGVLYRRGNSVLSYYGRVSYSLYLWHLVVLWLLSAQVHKLVEDFHGVGIGVSILFILTVATIVADISYRLIERRGIALGNALFARLRNFGSLRQIFEEP